MARTSQREVLAERQDAAQLALIDDQAMPVEAAALESVRARRYEHQGLRLTEDDAKAQRLVELLTLKWGVKRISREMSISAHTVRAARRLLVAQGKMAPYKQRVVEMMEDAIEAGVEKYRDAMEAGLVPAAQIPIGTAIMFDKRALAMGEPTSIRGTGEVQSEDLKVEALNAYLEQLPVARVTAVGPATDSQSTGNGQNPQQTEGSRAQDVILDATPAGPGAGSGELAGRASTRPHAERTDGTATGPRARAGQGGGGGRDGGGVE